MPLKINLRQNGPKVPIMAFAMNILSQQLVEVKYNFVNNYLTVVPSADSDLRRCHMHLYASVPDFILQNNRTVKR
jgi:hypothetical protein